MNEVEQKNEEIEDYRMRLEFLHEENENLRLEIDCLNEKLRVISDMVTSYLNRRD